jgi:hypothetical protein
LAAAASQRSRAFRSHGADAKGADHRQRDQAVLNLFACIEMFLSNGRKGLPYGTKLTAN